MDIMIHGYCQLGYGRDILEDFVEAYFKKNGEVTGAGAGESGWNLDVEINRDLTDRELSDFSQFLISVKVPAGTTLDCYFENGRQQQQLVLSEG